MKFFLLLALFCVAAFSLFATEITHPKLEHDYPAQQIMLRDIKMQDDFWLPRLETTRDVTVNYCMDYLEFSGFLKVLEIAAGESDEMIPTNHEHYMPSFSDIVKNMEAMSMILQSYPEQEELKARLEKYIDLIGKSQYPDGYIMLHKRIAEKGKLNNPKGHIAFLEPYAKLYPLNSFELYNVGHMYWSAVEYYYATGDRSYLDIALKNADHLAERFHEQDQRKPSGHPSIEVGLAHLYKVTGDKKYIELDKFLIDQRGRRYEGRGTMGEYNIDHASALEQTEVTGHAVVAQYFYSGMVDLSAMTGDMRYAEAARKMWLGAVDKKMHATGAFGVSLHEGFPDDYELPNERAYCESCAAIATIMWTSRLGYLYEDAKYFDVLERTLYNGFLSSISLSGNKFNYQNKLQSSGSYTRGSWVFHCCPTNIPRMMASFMKYFYAYSDDSIFVNLYGANTTDFVVKGKKVSLTQDTDYPWKGDVKIKVNPENPAQFAVKLRIPGWAQNDPIPGDLYEYMNKSDAKVKIKVNGKKIPLKTDKGYLTIMRKWSEGDIVELRLPMEPRKLLPHPEIWEDTGRVALQRGPMLYCVEGTDNKTDDYDVLDMVISDDVKLSIEHKTKLLNGVTVIKGDAAYKTVDDKGKTVFSKGKFQAIPYYAWDNRGFNKMAVWIPRTKEESLRNGTGYTLYPVEKVSMKGGQSIKDFGDTPLLAGKIFGSAETEFDAGGNGKGESAVLVFDGKGGVNFGCNRKLYMRDSMTVAFWAKVNKGAKGTILGRGHYEDDEKHSWNLSVDENGHLALKMSESSSFTSKVPVDDGQWHHVMLVLDHASNEKRHSFYIDGREDKSVMPPYGNSIVLNGPEYPLYAGCKAGRDYFTGMLDDIGIWDAVLTKEQRTTVYEKGVIGANIINAGQVSMKYLLLKNEYTWGRESSFEKYQSELPLMTDNNLGTIFSSRSPQEPGMFVQFELQAITPVQKILLDSGSSSNDYPRGFKVLVSTDGKKWEEAFNGKGYGHLVEADLNGSQAKFIRIVLIEQAPNWWAIAEFDVGRSY